MWNCAYINPSAFTTSRAIGAPSSGGGSSSAASSSPSRNTADEAGLYRGFFFVLFFFALILSVLLSSVSLQVVRLLPLPTFSLLPHSCLLLPALLLMTASHCCGQRMKMPCSYSTQEVRNEEDGRSGMARNLQEPGRVARQAEAAGRTVRISSHCWGPRMKGTAPTRWKRGAGESCRERVMLWTMRSVRLRMMVSD